MKDLTEMIGEDEREYTLQIVYEICNWSNCFSLLLDYLYCSTATLLKLEDVEFSWDLYRLQRVG